MKLTRTFLLGLKEVPNSFCYALRIEFLFNSNKLEGSNFNRDTLNQLADKNIVSGTHTWDDVIETRNSLDVFDFVIETLDEPLFLQLIREYHQLLKNGTSDINLHDLSYFHSNFEKIHPFQDGNGRIGRFLLLKQCLENNIDLIAIDEKYNNEYRAALFESQLNGNYDKLIEISKKCQEYIKSKEDIIFSSNEALQNLKKQK